MRKIAVTNAKGGVAKTTTSANLAFGLAKVGMRVLVVDLDTQGQAAVALGVQPPHGLAAVARGQVGLDAALCEARENLFLLAGGRELAGLQQVIAQREMASERVLSEVLEGLQDFDFVIVDTAPSWGPLNINCLFYVDEILLPVNMETLSLHGVVDFVQSVEGVQKYRDGLAITTVLPTFFDARTKKSQEILDQLTQYFGASVVASPIRLNVKLSEAAGQGLSVFEYAPRSNGARDYATLVQRVLEPVDDQQAEHQE